MSVAANVAFREFDRAPFASGGWWLNQSAFRDDASRRGLWLQSIISQFELAPAQSGTKALSPGKAHAKECLLAISIAYACRDRSSRGQTVPPESAARLRHKQPLHATTDITRATQLRFDSARRV
jgi:hypothetical protein